MCTMKVDYLMIESLEEEWTGRIIDLAMALQIKAGQFTKTRDISKVTYPV